MIKVTHNGKEEWRRNWYAELEYRGDVISCYVSFLAHGNTKEEALSNLKKQVEMFMNDFSEQIKKVEDTDKTE